MSALRPIPIGRSYRVVLADPPWRFNLYSDRGEAKSAQAQYSCMGQSQLVAFARDIRLDFLTAPDAALVMWATWPMIANGDAVALMRAWGFTPKTGSAWFKTTRLGKAAFGTGYILRTACEPWLLGTRGAPVIASRSERGTILTEDELDAIVAERREHSRKPDEMYGIVERLFPGGPYLELFARRQRLGWDAYGDELGGFVPDLDAPALGGAI